MSIFKEFKRRNVFKVAIAYLIVSWLLIQIVAVVSPILELPDVFSKMILILLLVGFPVSLVLAWAFELTPEGIKRSLDVPEEHSISHLTNRKIDFIIIGAMIMIIAGMAYERLTLDTSATSTSTPSTPSTTEHTVEKIPSASIAVLPFVNMSSDTEQEYFSDGISEEILNVLAKIPNLHVTSRSSAFLL